MSDAERVRTMNEIKEQEEIVARYELGRELGVEIDAWEDPSFEVYHVTDHFGFIHQDKIPEQIAKLDSKFIEKKLNREKKWLIMTKDAAQWEKAVKANKVTERTYKGIPEKVRGKAWCLMLNIKTTMEKNQGVYENMRDLSKRWSTYVKQIDLDINRTFRNHIMFRRRYDFKQQALFNVLCAYSLYDEDVGYCQGMSEVAALLLMFMNEEEAFWCFATLMTDEKHNMRGFFLPSFPKLIRYKDHHDEIMRKYIKKVKKHLDKNGVHTMSFCIKWFMQCFLDRVPFSLALRFWDIYIWEGEGLLVAAAYTIIRIQKDRLVRLSDEEILKLFQSDLVEDFGCNDEVVIRALKLSTGELRQSNKLIPKNVQGSEGFNKKLGSFIPPQVSEVASGDVTIISRVASMYGTSDPSTSARVSIPADGGPELGVDLLIEQDETGWRTMGRFLSQECFDDLADKSDNSPLFRMRQQAEDGLSACTSIASHDYDNSSFYEGDDDLSAVVNKDGRGSPDTLNGSNDITQIQQEDDEKHNAEKSLFPPSKSHPITSSNPESLHPHGKDSIQDALAFYKTIPSLPIGTKQPGVPYNSTTNHITSLDPSTNHGMPYSQSSGNVRNASSPITPGIKHYPRYPPGQDLASGYSGSHMYGAFKKNTSVNSSYLGKKVQNKNVKQPVKQGVSVVMIGEENDVILSSNNNSSTFPTSFNKKTNGQIQCGGVRRSGDDVHRQEMLSESTSVKSNELFKKPESSTVTLVRGQRHHSTSDLARENYSLRRFVSSKPMVNTSLYHPDYKGVTRIWTGSPVSSARLNNSIRPMVLNQQEQMSSVYSSPTKKDKKNTPTFYTRF